MQHDKDRYDLIEYIAGEVGKIREIVDDIRETTVKKADCSECKKDWKEAISSKVSKRDFAVASSVILAVVGTLSIGSLYIALASGLVKMLTP